jgi:hypothetical protein
MTFDTPEARMLTAQEGERRRAVVSPVRVEMNRYGSWAVRDERGKWDIQRSFHGYREACLFRDSLVAYEAGRIEDAGRMNQQAVNGERWYRHG